MNEIKKINISQITDFLKNEEVDFKIYGNTEACILGFSAFNNYQKDTVTWIKNFKKYQKFGDFERKVVPALIIIDAETEAASTYPTRLVCDNPKYVFSLILKEFFEDKAETGIGKGSIVSEEAYLEGAISIGCNCVIERDVSIGEGTKIYHNVVIRKGTVIGKNCVIKSGTVIGEEGYGYSQHEDKIVHTPHFGYVVLEDEVEIGSNCSIDRGTMGNTVIGMGSKIDNLCHIAHNVQIGKNVMVVANSIICGSVCIKDGAYIAPGGIIKNQIEIGEKCVVGMGSVVLNNTQNNKVLVGVPAKELRDVGKEDL